MANKKTLDDLMTDLGADALVANLPAVFGLEEKFLRPFALPVGLRYAPGAFGEALAAADAAKARRPKDADVLAARGRLLRLLGRKKEALAELDAALDLEPENARALCYRGEAYLHMGGKSELGLLDLEAGTRLRPKDAWPRVWAAAARLTLSSAPEALAVVDAAIEADPDNACARMLRAVGRLQQRQPAKGLPDAEKAAALAPSCVGARIIKARLEAAAGKTAAAEASLAQAARLEPDAKMFYGFLVSARGVLDNNAEGLALLDAFLRKNPKAGWARALRGDLLRTPGLGRSKEGSEELERAVELDGRTPWIRACVGRARVQDANDERGLADIEAALAQDPECAWLHMWRGEALRRFKRFDESLAAFERALALAPGLAQAQLWLGRVQAENKRFEPAAEAFSAALAVEPSYGFAYAKRGQALAQLGRHAEAAADFDRSFNLKVPGEREWIYGLRAASRLALGDAAGSFDDLGRAIRLDLKRCWFPVQYGAKAIDPRSWEALTWLDEALSVDPNAAWAYGWRGAARLGLGRLEDGLGDLDRALSLDPLFAYAYGFRGRALWQTGRVERGLADFDAALSLQAGCGWLWSWRAEARLGAERPKDALEDCARALALSGRDAHAWYCRGEALRQLGQDAESRAALDRAIQLDGQHTFAFVSRAMLRGAQGDVDGQLRDFREVARLAPDLLRQKAAEAAGPGGAAIDPQELLDTLMKLEAEPPR